MGWSLRLPRQGCQGWSLWVSFQKERGVRAVPDYYNAGRSSICIISDVGERREEYGKREGQRQAKATGSCGVTARPAEPGPARDPSPSPAPSGMVRRREDMKDNATHYGVLGSRHLKEGEIIEQKVCGAPVPFFNRPKYERGPGWDPLNSMACPARFERAIFGSAGRRSIRAELRAHWLSGR